MKKTDKTVPIQKDRGGSGGVTSAAMKQYGRNVARAMNQKSSGKSRGR
jgi:hypothetical protein